MGIVSINLKEDTLTNFDKTYENIINKNNKKISRSHVVNLLLDHVLSDEGYLTELLQSYGFILVTSESGQRLEKETETK